MTYEELRTALEPGADSHGSLSLEKTLQVSQAISAKRTADALETIAFYVRAMADGGRW